MSQFKPVNLTPPVASVTGKSSVIVSAWTSLNGLPQVDRAGGQHRTFIKGTSTTEDLYETFKSQQTVKTPRCTIKRRLFTDCNDRNMMFSFAPLNVFRFFYVLVIEIKPERCFAWRGNREREREKPEHVPGFTWTAAELMLLQRPAKPQRLAENWPWACLLRWAHRKAEVKRFRTNPLEGFSVEGVTHEALTRVHLLEAIEGFRLMKELGGGEFKGWNIIKLFLYCVTLLLLSQISRRCQQISTAGTVSIWLFISHTHGYRWQIERASLCLRAWWWIYL